jgi:hypothetical protein
MLPVPSWKLVVEVYDPGTMLHTVEVAVAEINRELEAAGREERVEIESIEADGRTYTTLGRTGATQAVTFTTVDGYLIMAPSRALVDFAIDSREAGVTLPASESFQALLPDNGYTNCSALVYRDLGSLLETVPPEMLGQLEFMSAMSEELASGLVCAFGEPQRITASATGGGLIGLGSMLALPNALQGDELADEVAKIDTLSSQG